MVALAAFAAQIYHTHTHTQRHRRTHSQAHTYIVYRIHAIYTSVHFSQLFSRFELRVSAILNTRHEMMLPLPLPENAAKFAKVLELPKCRKRHAAWRDTDTRYRCAIQLQIPQDTWANCAYCNCESSLHATRVGVNACTGVCRCVCVRACVRV